MSELFSGTRVPGELIGRETDMQAIYAALYDPGDDLRVVLVRGPGGYGKTRMLREVMRRAGHQGERQTQGGPGPAKDWYASHGGGLHISDLVDLTWVRLATTIHFQHQLQTALSAEGSGFFNFNRCFLHYRDQLTYQSNPEQMDKALQEAELAFRKDYQILSKQRRMVWVLDTAEKFAWPGDDWALPLPPEHAGQSDVSNAHGRLAAGHRPLRLAPQYDDPDCGARQVRLAGTCLKPTQREFLTFHSHRLTCRRPAPTSGNWRRSGNKSCRIRRSSTCLRN